MTTKSDSTHFSPYQLSEGIFAAIAIDGGYAISNAGIIDLGEQIVVFDTFLTPQAAMHLRRFTEERLGRAPQIVVNSHYHNDHIWGNQVFVPGAQIISSDRTRQLIATDGMEEFQWYSENSAQRLAALRSQYQEMDDEQGRNQLALWLGYYEGLVQAIPSLSVTMPDITFKERLEIHGSKHTAELITFEGAHTESDSVLYLPGEGIIFMSDLLFVGYHPYLADGDPFKLLEALKALSQLDAPVLIPGHGPVGSIGDLRKLIEYIDHCLETAQILVDRGNVSEDNITALEIADPFKDWQLSNFYQANIRFLCQRLSL